MKINKNINTIYRFIEDCARSRKVAGLIPDGVGGNVHSFDPSGRTMVLRSIESLTEMSTRDLSCGGLVKSTGA